MLGTAAKMRVPLAAGALLAVVLWRNRQAREHQPLPSAFIPLPGGGPTTPSTLYTARAWLATGLLLGAATILAGVLHTPVWAGGAMLPVAAAGALALAETDAERRRPNGRRFDGVVTAVAYAVFGLFSGWVYGRMFLLAAPAAAGVVIRLVAERDQDWSHPEGAIAVAMLAAFAAVTVA